jgi:L-glutamine-phosphate cytidylyltransferase
MTRAIILAAGQGTRLRPLTNSMPKCLVPLQGKTLLERQVLVLKGEGVHDIHVVGGHCVEQIRKAGYNCSVNLKYETTNMVETLFTALPFIEAGGNLIISYGDIVYQDDNLQKVLQCNDEICLMIDLNWRRYWELRFEDPLSDAETLIFDSKGYITELGKKPAGFDQIKGQYTGLIKVRSDKIKEFVNFYKSLDRRKIYDGKDFPNMYMTSFLQELIDSSWKVKGVFVENGWLEVDSVEDLEIYEQLSKVGKLDTFCQLEVSV